MEAGQLLEFPEPDVCAIPHLVAGLGELKPMNDEGSLIAAGLRIVNRHKRFIFWFWVLNLILAWFGTTAFRYQVHDVMDHSLYADKLLHGFDLSVFVELLSRPETGSVNGSTKPAINFALLFFVATLLLMPGVLEAFTSEGRLSREDFFRACGRNLWGFLRLLLFFAIIAGPIAGLLFGAQAGLAKAATKSTNEMMPFYTSLIKSLVIFLVLTAIRIWFDLAQVDIVVRDQSAVRKSVATGFRYLGRHLVELLATYVGIALVGLLILVAGIWGWHVLVSPSNVVGAFVISQLMLILWLWARFWQRASAAAYYLRETAITVPVPVLANPEPVPTPEPITPPLPPFPEGTAPA
jgi:hypothetical protein